MLGVNPILNAFAEGSDNNEKANVFGSHLAEILKPNPEEKEQYTNLVVSREVAKEMRINLYRRRHQALTDEILKKLPTKRISICSRI